MTTVKELLGFKEPVAVAVTIVVNKMIIATEVADPLSEMWEELMMGNEIAAAVTVALLTTAAMTILPVSSAVVNTWHL